jgi:hypothetical protein
MSSPPSSICHSFAPSLSVTANFLYLRWWRHTGSGTGLQRTHFAPAGLPRPPPLTPPSRPNNSTCSISKAITWAIKGKKGATRPLSHNSRALHFQRSVSNTGRLSFLRFMSLILLKYHKEVITFIHSCPPLTEIVALNSSSCYSVVK